MGVAEMELLRNILAGEVAESYITAREAAMLEEWVSRLRRKAAAWDTALRLAGEDMRVLQVLAAAREAAGATNDNPAGG